MPSGSNSTGAPDGRDGPPYGLQRPPLLMLMGALVAAIILAIVIGFFGHIVGFQVSDCRGVESARCNTIRDFIRGYFTLLAGSAVLITWVAWQQGFQAGWLKASFILFGKVLAAGTVLAFVISLISRLTA
ncbi:MAG: hypothetical protein KAZ88_01525 [Acidimicrobiia bacterium]|jgi:hypothetical protein|nr:hypothetical protein [Acidimicrobiia bacterium]